MLDYDELLLKKKETDDWNISNVQVQHSWLTCLQQRLIKKESDDWNMSKEQVQRSLLASSKKFM